MTTLSQPAASASRRESARFMTNAALLPETELTRTVEAINWFDRARIRNRRLQMPLFRSEVQNSTVEQDLAGIAEEASKNVYRPTMNSTGLHMRTIQQDLAEAAHDGGLGIGEGAFGYGKPVGQLAEMDGMRTPGFSGSTLGRLFGALQQNPQAVNKLVTQHPISAGVFEIEVPATATTLARTVDLASPVNSLTAEELGSLDEFTKTLFQSKQITPQQILDLHDKLQAGQRFDLKSGPNAAGYMDRIMGDVGETLRADASRIGTWNLVATLGKIGGVVASGLGFAVAAGLWGRAMIQMPSPDLGKAFPLQSSGKAATDPFAASTTTDPSAAFGAGSTPSATPAPAGTTSPFGAVSQNFGTLPSSSSMSALPPPPVSSSQGVGLMPTVNGAPVAVQPNDYQWTRINAAAGRVLIAQSAQMTVPKSFTGSTEDSVASDQAAFETAINAALQGAPSTEQIESAIQSALLLGDTPQGHQRMIGLLQQFAAQIGPQIDNFDAQGNAGV